MPPVGGPEPRPRPELLAGWTAAERRARDAIEELRAALHAPGLRTQVDGKTPEAREAEIAGYLADVDAWMAGPRSQRVSALPRPAEPDAFLVEGLIRPGTTVMLTGPPGSSKSWLARQLAMSAAAGLHSFLERYAIPRPLKVLTIDEDNGPDEEWRRDETLLAHLGLQRSQLADNLQRISLAGVQLDQPRWQEWFRGQVRLEDFDLVICDPISEMHGGKELREDPAFRSLLGFLKRLKVDFPAVATLLVHHTRKAMSGDRSNERGLDDVRGQWGQTPDVVALMWPLGERRVAWETHKRVPHSKLILEASQSGPLTLVADETTARSRAMQNDDLVIEAIRGGLTTFAALQDGTNLAKGTLHGVLKRLVASRTVAKHGALFEVVEEEL